MLKNQIDLAIQYIEQNISQPLCVELLAEISGYSVYHFAHSFRKQTGLSVSDYIRRQRLSLAATDILNDVSVTKSSMKYGFETPSGFSKAFRKYFGMSPNEYKATYYNYLEPKFEKRSELTAIVYLLTPSDKYLKPLQAGAYWCGKDFLFSQVSAEDWQRILNPAYGELGAWIPSQNSPSGFEYAFGPIVYDTSFVPKHMSVITLPAANYAVFEVPRTVLHTQLSRNINSLCKKIHERWFASGELHLDEAKVAFELYRGEDTYIYIPIRAE